MDYNQMALELHKKYKGKIEVISKVPLENKDDLSTAYTPGVAQPCLEIKKNPDDVYKYTSKSNLIAVVSDGSAVLGLGNIGATASIPVMEGKCVLFKELGGVDAFPICIKTQEVDEIVNIVKNIESVFGGINIEDVSGPRCFELEQKLRKTLDIPVFHDDQHGTAIVTTAAVINALKLADKKLEESEVVINGAGAAGNAITRLLLSLNVKNVVVCDRKGALNINRDGLDNDKRMLAELTNKNNEKGVLKDIIKDKDIFIGVSAPGTVTKEMIESMNDKPIVFPMANPTPEIMPELAKEAGAFIIGTGRSDFPNQVNNVLAFPGVFRGTLDVKASDINEEMKIAAAYAIAESVKDKDLSVDYILPDPFSEVVHKNVAEGVSKAAIETGVARSNLQRFN